MTANHDILDSLTIVELPFFLSTRCVWNPYFPENLRVLLRMPRTIYSVIVASHHTLLRDKIEHCHVEHVEPLDGLRKNAGVYVLAQLKVKTVISAPFNDVYCPL